MKGIETLPLQLVASVILISIVISIGWYEVHNFLAFKNEKEFKESMVRIYQSMKDLETVSDEGAFTGATVNIPSGWVIRIDLADDRIIGFDSKGNSLFSFRTNCTNMLEARDSAGNLHYDYWDITSDISEIRLVYGDLTDIPRISIRFSYDSNGC